MLSNSPHHFRSHKIKIASDLVGLLHPYLASVALPSYDHPEFVPFQTRPFHQQGLRTILVLVLVINAVVPYLPYHEWTALFQRVGRASFRANMKIVHLR